MARGTTWRMKEMCSNCPFARKGDGAKLARSLAPGRMKAIKAGLLRGEHFTCHKTTDETGDGSNLVCAGALAYQEKHGVSSQLQRTMERLDAIIGRER